MLKYIGKRLLLMIPVVLGISLLVFALLDLSPGDAAEIILGTKATPEALAALRAEMGLDQPFWVRYFTYPFRATSAPPGGPSCLWWMSSWPGCPRP